MTQTPASPRRSGRDNGTWQTEDDRLRVLRGRRRGETGCMGARIVMPLRILLPCLAVCLVASGAAAIGVAGVSAADGYLMRQAHHAPRAPAPRVLHPGRGAVARPRPAPR